MASISPDPRSGPDPFARVPDARTSRPFVLDVPRTSLYAHEFVSGSDEHPRHPLSYTTLHLLRAHGATADALAVDDSAGVRYVRRLGARSHVALARRSLAGDRIIALGMHGPLAGLLRAASVGSPAVLSYLYGLEDPARHGIAERMRRAFRRNGLHRSLVVAASSQRVLGVLKTAARLSDEQVCLWRAGVDTDFFHPAAGNDAPHGGDESRGSVLPSLPFRGYVCVSGDVLRRHHLVFEALRRLPVTIVRTTRNPIEAQVVAEAAAMPDARFDLRLLRDLPFTALRTLYQRAAAIIVCADSSWQPAGWTALCEALAVGTPALVARGINTEEVSLLTNEPDESRLCVGVWDPRAPATLLPLVEACLRGDWPASRIQAGIDLTRAGLDLDRIAAGLFATPQWQRFLQA